MRYDPESRLRELDRADGSRITYEYRSDGLLHRRNVICAGGAVGCVDEERVYLYDALQLLEEYVDLGGTTELRARYFYADSGDMPVAVDLWDGVMMRRYFYLCDRQGSVLGLADDGGAVVERYSYDPWPTVHPFDADAPDVAAIEVAANGDLLIALTEPVVQPVSGAHREEGDVVVVNLSWSLSTCLAKTLLTTMKPKHTLTEACFFGAGPGSVTASNTFSSLLGVSADRGTHGCLAAPVFRCPPRGPIRVGSERGGLPAALPRERTARRWPGRSDRPGHCRDRRLRFG